MSVQVTLAIFTRRVSALAIASTMMIAGSAAAQDQPAEQETEGRPAVSPPPTSRHGTGLLQKAAA